MEFKGRIIVRLLCVLVLQSGLSAFNFPSGADNPPPPAQPAPMLLDPGFGLERQSITPAIVTPANSCICVPTGQCTFGTTGNTDGSGLIDIRIVNSVSNFIIFDLDLINLYGIT